MDKTDKKVVALLKDFGVGSVSLAREVVRLRNVIECGCNAIQDSISMSGERGDLVRINAIQRRMRREMSVIAPSNSPQKKTPE